MKVKTILVSQPEPKIENSPYFDLQEKQRVKIDFRPFIHVEGVSAKEIRHQKIDLSDYTAIILTSRNAVDHFFRIAEEMRFKVPDTMKYFCQSEAVAYYLQKYVVLFKNFPDFKQNETRIAVFGNTTIKAVEEKGLRVDIAAPTPETPSMTMALQKYIEKANKGK